MNSFTVGFILGWLGLVHCYHLAPPVYPSRRNITTTPKPTTTTAPVEYEPPEIEGPVSTTTTVATTTTKKPTTYAHGHGPPPGGYYDHYGQYHYDPYYNAQQDPYGAYGSSYGHYGYHSSRAPYPTQVAHPSQAPYGSGAQSHYTDPYAPRYDPSTGQYTDPYHGGKDPYFGANQGLKPRGQTALMDQLSIIKPQPSASPSYGHSGKWIEMRAANDLRMKSRRRNRQGSTRRRGYIPRGEKQTLKRVSPTASNYHQGSYAGSKSRVGGSQSNWQNQQRPQRRQQQAGFNRRNNNGQQSGQGKQNTWNKGNSGYNAWSYQQSQYTDTNTGGISQPSSSYSGSAYQNQNNQYNKNTAYDNNAYANTASQVGSAAVQPSPYPSSATGQNSNYYATGSSGYNQGQGTGTSSNAYNQQGYDYYGSGSTGTGSGTGSMTSNIAYNTPAPSNYGSGYNSQGAYNYDTSATSSQQQTYYNNNQNAIKQGSNTFGLGTQGASYNYDTSYNNQGMSTGNYDAGGSQMQTGAYDTAGSWGGQNFNMDTQTGQSNWNTGNSFGQGQSPNTVSDTISDYMTMNNANSGFASKTGSSSIGSTNSGKTNEQNVAETMIKMLEKLKTAAAANASTSVSTSSTPSKTQKQEPVQISKSMEAAIKNAIINAAKDISNKMKADKTTYVGTQETYQRSPSVQAVDTSFKADITSPYGWTQPPTTTVQTWTEAPTTTAAPTAGNRRWGPTGGMWGTSSSGNYYGVTLSPRGRAGGQWGTAAPTTPKVSFLGKMSRKRLASTMTPRTTQNPMKGFQQLLLASVLFNKK
ncbi:hornerin-like [Ylistrum balloti]|uniref:hornerin-like n=1 Tax=Ylistrum balloti TaxID=509963 RepID=UPI002905D644|nr:hornerin-like [Ylistrum balloti]